MLGTRAVAELSLPPRWSVGTQPVGVTGAGRRGSLQECGLAPRQSRVCPLSGVGEAGVEGGPVIFRQRGRGHGVVQWPKAGESDDGGTGWRMEDWLRAGRTRTFL